MKKFDNYKKALNNLQECKKYEPPYNIVTETGLVNLFSICFEQSWKAMKEILQKHGYDEGKTESPKMIIELAYSAGMIQNETIWLEILDMRNEIAYSYNQEVAADIIEKTKSQYIRIFEELEKELTTNWI